MVGTIFTCVCIDTVMLDFSKENTVRVELESSGEARTHWLLLMGTTKLLRGMKLK